MIANVKRIWYVDNVVDFVKTFGLEERFKEKYGTDIDNWNFEMSDDEIIEELLSELKETYFFVYNEYNDEFEIYEIEV